MADEAAPTETLTPTPTSEAAPVAAVAAPESTDAPAVVEAAEPTALGGAGDKPEGEAEGAKVEGAPEAYELTMPEGLTLDATALDAATPVFREMGLTNEQAQQLMPVAANFAQKIADGLNQKIIGDVAADRKAWLDTAKADTELGGANWDQTISVAAKGLDQLGFTKGTPFRNLLDESGLGNHPDMIRAWSRVGKAIGEDSDFVRSGQNASVKKTDQELFYPGMSKGA